jgi:hypothetical protein
MSQLQIKWKDVSTKHTIYYKKKLWQIKKCNNMNKEIYIITATTTINNKKITNYFINSYETLFNIDENGHIFFPVKISGSKN